jgi:hypothetical protein
MRFDRVCVGVGNNLGNANGGVRAMQILQRKGPLMSEQIEPGDGWRLIDTTKEEKRDGDEFWSFAYKKWVAVSWDEGFCSGYTYRRRIPAKPEAMEIDDGFRVELGNNLDHFAILQAGPPDSSGDVVIGNAIEARQLADWLIRYANWREAQGETK